MTPDDLVIVSLRAACLATVVGLADATLLRRAWPSLRAALWACVLASLAVPARWASPVAWRVGWESGAEVSTSAAGEAGTSPLVVAWLVGAACAVVGAAFVARRREAALLRDACAPSRRVLRRIDVVARRAGLSRAPRVVSAPHAGGPCVVGRLRPVVLLPPGLPRRIDDGALDDVLLHEFTHVARRDPLGAACASLVALVFWFHPAAWIAARRLATLREFCCDADVARRLGDDVPRYRRTLARCALLDVAPTAALGLLGRARRPALLARLAALESPRRIVPTTARRVVSALTVALVLAALPARVELAPPAPLAATLPPGCMQLRHAVLAARAQALGHTPPADPRTLLTASR